MILICGGGSNHQYSFSLLARSRKPINAQDSMRDFILTRRHDQANSCSQGARDICFKTGPIGLSNNDALSMYKILVYFPDVSARQSFFVRKSCFDIYSRHPNFFNIQVLILLQMRVPSILLSKYLILHPISCIQVERHMLLEYHQPKSRIDLPYMANLWQFISKTL
jgi:hypothetical protein